MQIHWFAFGLCSPRDMNHLSCAKLPESGSLIQSFKAVNQFRALSGLLIRKKKKKKAANLRPNWSSVNAMALSPVASIQHLTSVLSIALCQRPWIESLQLETLGNDWAKSPTHLQHSLISWERDGSVYACESMRTPTHFITRQLIQYLKLSQHFLSLRFPLSFCDEWASVLLPQFTQLLEILSQWRQRCRVKKQRWRQLWTFTFSSKRANINYSHFR